MVLVEHAAGVRDVEVVLGRRRPRQVDDPLEVGAHDAVLGRLDRNDAQPLELLLGGLARHLGRVGVLELLSQLVDLALARIAFAELLLDRPHLLAQVEVALVLRQLVLHLRLDLLPQLEQLDLAVEDAGQALEALAHVDSVASSSCFSSSETLRLEAMRSVTLPGSLMFIATTCSSSGR